MTAKCLDQYCRALLISNYLDCGIEASFGYDSRVGKDAVGGSLTKDKKISRIEIGQDLST
jgi:hypothetical protein